MSCLGIGLGVASLSGKLPNNQTSYAAAAAVLRAWGPIAASVGCLCCSHKTLWQQCHSVLVVDVAGGYIMYVAAGTDEITRGW